MSEDDPALHHGRAPRHISSDTQLLQGFEGCSLDDVGCQVKALCERLLAGEGSDPVLDIGLLKAHMPPLCAWYANYGSSKPSESCEHRHSACGCLMLRAHLKCPWPLRSKRLTQLWWQLGEGHAPTT